MFVKAGDSEDFFSLFPACPYLSGMIKNWLQAPDLSGLPPSAFLPYMVGQHLAVHQLRQRDLKKVSVCLLGLDAAFAKKTRAALYAMSWNFGTLGLADLGDLRKPEPDFLIPLLRELQSAGILPILIGADRQLFRAQYQSFQEISSQLSVVVIDQQIRLSTRPAAKVLPEVLDPAFHNKRKHFYHLSHLGAQQHLVDPAIFGLLEARHFDYVRLGQARDHIIEQEPLIRDADLLGLDISALQYFDAPAQQGYHPSGFTLEEATRLCRYAGISDKLQSFGIYGANEQCEERDQLVTAAAYAQMIWYFLDGFVARKGDYPVSATGLTEYVVDLKDFDRITFWKSPRSGRWWIQAPAGKHKGEERHRLIPCSYQDYLQASQQEIPDRLMQAFKRYSMGG